MSPSSVDSSSEPEAVVEAVEERQEYRQFPAPTKARWADASNGRVSHASAPPPRLICVASKTEEREEEEERSTEEDELPPDVCIRLGEAWRRNSTAESVEVINDAGGGESDPSSKEIDSSSDILRWTPPAAPPPKPTVVSSKWRPIPVRPDEESDGDRPGLFLGMGFGLGETESGAGANDIEGAVETR